MESYYDNIEGFEYWNIEKWNEYIKEHILPLHKNIRILLELKEELNKYVGKSLGELDEKLRVFLIGGISEKGKYEDYALAKLIKLLTGIYVEPEEYAKKVEELGEYGLYETIIKSEESKFLKYIEKMYNFSNMVLSKTNLEQYEIEPIDEYINNPEKILDVLADFYKLCVNFSAVCNYYTFFILSFNGVHYKYLATAYPKLKENFDGLKEYLGITTLVSPNTNSDEFNRDYSILTFENSSIGYGLFYTQVAIFGLFNSEVSEKIFKYITPKPLNLMEEYYNIAKYKINTDIEIGGFKIYDKVTCRIWFKNAYIHEIEYKHRIDSYYSSHKLNNQIPLSELLNKIAPLVFLKFMSVSDYEVSSDYFTIYRKLDAYGKYLNP